MKKSSERQARYDAKTARRYGLKLHLENDKDIITRLDLVDSMQGYIKDLIRVALNLSAFMRVLARKNADGYRLTFASGEGGRIHANMSKSDPLSGVEDTILICHDNDYNVIVVRNEEIAEVYPANE